ncbi:MAG TPA: tripartite tricarboxylate transporter substrate-binding protein [Alphaproteobacteria bacterium]|jgi:tripartite-type tricarboxylate transporter receptor subunit TctC|nr:tripartite tricarboxylate transporter substrate-binding protein [Alphaproteobacteria bacterium]
MKSITFIAGGVALAACAASAPASAQFTLQGKTVNVIVSGGVGGGVDLYTRTLLPHLSKHLPGEPTMVVQNMPGAGGVQGVQRLYNLSARDGTAFATTPAGPIKEPLMGSGQVNYDLRKFRWIGSLAKEDTMCLVWHTSKIQNLDDAKKHEVTLSATGAGSNSTLGPYLLNDLLGTKFKPISGYDGGTSMLAVERGEVDGRCTTLSSVRVGQPRWIKEHLVRGLIAVSNIRDVDFPDVPKAVDLVKTEEERQALTFFQAPDEIQDPLFLPPETPDEVLKVYRQAFEDTMRDRAYIADAEKRHQVLSPRPGEEVEATINGMYATSQTVIDRVKRATTITGRGEGK